MTRQRILFVVSALTILLGIGWIWSFLSPIFDPNEAKVLNPVLVVLGVVFLLVGWGLFRRNEFALELGFWSWFTSLILNALSSAILLSKIGSLAEARNLIATVILLGLIAVQLFVVIFLSQQETKRLFISDSAKKVETSGE